MGDKGEEDSEEMVESGMVNQLNMTRVRVEDGEEAGMVRNRQKSKQTVLKWAKVDAII